MNEGFLLFEKISIAGGVGVYAPSAPSAPPAPRPDGLSGGYTVLYCI